MIPHHERCGMTRKRVLHCEMELTPLLPPLLIGEGWGEVKIERSAEALRVRHHPTIFPSEKTLQQYRASNGADKTAKDGK